MSVSPDFTRRISPRAAVLIPMCIAFVLRLIYVLTFRESPAFANLIMDEAVHDGWARGGMQFLYEGVPYFRAPLYMWFLEFNYLIDDGYLWVRLVQVLLSAVTVGIVADLGRRLAGPLAGLAGGLLLAFCWPVIYFSGELVIVTFFMALVSLALWSLVVAGERRSIALALTGAGLIGISALARPTSLVFLPAVLWLVLRTWRDWLSTARMRALAIGGMVALMLAPGLALTVRNQVVGGDAVFIASQGGLNFYIGNNPQSDGRTAVVPGTSATWDGGFVEAIQLAEQAEGRSLTPSEVSRHYFQRGFEFWTSDPGAALELYGRKLRMLVGASERSNNKNPHFWRDRNPILRLPVFSSWALVFAMGVVGIFLVRRRQQAAPLSLFLLLYAAGLMLFFINERFRTPETIVLAAFAGVPVAAVFEAWGERRKRAIAIIIGVVALLTLSSLDRIGFHGDEVEADAFSQHTLGNLYFRSGDMQRAAETYQMALANARSYRLRGFEEVEQMLRDSLVLALLRSDEAEAARRHVDYFVEAWPGDWRAPLLQGRIAFHEYNLGIATQHYREATQRNPGATEAWLGIARYHMERLEFDPAEDCLKMARQTGGDDRADVWGAYALFTLINPDKTDRQWRYAERALDLDPGDALAHRVMGGYYLSKGDQLSMLYHFRFTLLREPNNIPVGRALRRAGLDPEEVRARDDLPVPPPRK